MKSVYVPCFKTTRKQKEVQCDACLWRHNKAKKRHCNGNRVGEETHLHYMDDTLYNFEGRPILPICKVIVYFEPGKDRQTTIEFGPVMNRRPKFNQ